MADGQEIAQAYVQIIPSTQGIGKNIQAAIASDTNGESIGQSLGSKISSGLGTGLKAVGGTMLAVTGAATTLATGITKIAESSAATADTVDKMSQKIGVSREAYQELDFICSQSGMSVSSLQAGMKTLTSAIDGAASGTKNNVAQFEALGVAFTDSEGNMRGQEEVMWETLSALQSMENQTEKARLATELFGKSGTELMPLLNSEAGSIEAMKEQAHDLGLVLSDDVIDNGVALTDSLDQTKRAFSSLATNLGGQLAPLITEFSNGLQDMIPLISDTLGDIAPVLVDAFSQIMPLLLNLVKAVLPIIVDAVQLLLPPLLEIVNAVLPIVVDLMSAFLPLFESLLPVLQPLLDLLVTILAPVLQLVAELIKPIISLLTIVIQKIVEYITPQMELLTTVINEKIIPAFKTFGTTFKTVFSAVWDICKNIVNKVLGGIESLVNGVISGINFMLSGVSKVANAVGSVLGLDPINLQLNTISLPRLEKGGILERGQIGFLEGNGAEAVVPLENNSKWISAVAKDMDNTMSSSSELSILEEIRQGIENLQNMNIVMDTGATVGALAMPMNNALGKMMAREGRR